MVSKHHRMAVRKYKEDASRLPPPEEEWTYSEVDLSWKAFMKFYEYGIITSVGMRSVEKDGGRHEAKEWKTTGDGWAAVEEYGYSGESMTA